MVKYPKATELVSSRVGVLGLDSRHHPYDLQGIQEPSQREPDPAAP